MAAIQLSEDTMSRILTEAIIQGIGEDERNNIIAQAIAYLTTPQKSAYGFQDKKTPLQEAFDTAMGIYVRTVVREFIERDETTKAAVEEQLAALLGQFGERMQADYELRNVVTEAVVGYFADKER